MSRAQLSNIFTTQIFFLFLLALRVALSTAGTVTTEHSHERNAAGNATGLVVARVYLYSQLKLKGSKFPKTQTANVCPKNDGVSRAKVPKGFTGGVLDLA